MKIGRVRCCSLACLLLLSVGQALVAQQPRAAAAATRHSLWKAEGKRSAVYLLGSIHLLKAENYPLAPELEAAFTNADIVAFETDIEALEKLDAQLKLLGKARLPEGETLSEQLSPGLYARFTNYLADTGMPGALFEPLKPSMAAITLTMFEIQKLGVDPQYGLDKHFFNRARKAGKQIVPLETVDFQIALATDFSKEEGELFMKITLDDIDKVTKEAAKMLKAWQTGDADTLEKLLNEASRQAPAVFKRLLTNRNERWVPKIEDWLRGDKNVLVVVGAGHLVGAEGVVELLRKKGLKVTQL